LPVVDGDGRLVGIITVDDATKVINEEVEEDFAKMAAIVPTDRPYLRESPFSIFLTRIPWLLLLMLGATFTGLIITSFEEALAASVVLTAFIPMLMGTGGNSGSQASVTVIRGLSLGEIGYRNTLAVAIKELAVSLLCGVSLAAVNFGKMLLVDRLLLGNAAVTPMVALAVSLALAVTVVLAKLIGGLLPLLVGRVGLDPAVMAGPFITTLVDALSLLVYFALASALLGL
ncbi:MAG: magnesium transporter, partial [Clostridia bacterium]|nr:magnesium transporter [Clostridia bacterium]